MQPHPDPHSDPHSDPHLAGHLNVGQLPPPAGEVVEIAAMFAFTDVPSADQLRDPGWLEAHAAASAYALRMEHLTYFPNWEDEGLYEIALHLAVPVESPHAHSAMRGSAQLS